MVDVTAAAAFVHGSRPAHVRRRQARRTGPPNPADYLLLFGLRR